jgi:hypothetical protein
LFSRISYTNRAANIRNAEEVRRTEEKNQEAKMPRTKEISNHKIQKPPNSERLLNLNFLHLFFGSWHLGFLVLKSYA